MRRLVCPILLLSFFCSAALIADPPKAPPEVEQALRLRMDAFNKLLVAQKYREAEQFVLPESRDAYYTSEKPRVLDFEVKKINWDTDLQAATVEMSSNVTMHKGAMASFQVNTSYFGHWKLDKGEWWYFFPQMTERLTPWGVMKVNPAMAKESGLNVNQELAKGRAEMAAARAKTFAADRAVVTLPAKNSSETIVLSNLLPGAIKLGFRRTSGAGFDVSLNAVEVGPKATANLKIYRSGQNKAEFKPGTIIVRASPTGQTMAIEVN